MRIIRLSSQRVQHKGNMYIVEEYTVNGERRRRVKIGLL